jgi:hypothetical protein
LSAGHVAAGPCFDVNWFPNKEGLTGVTVNCTSDTLAGGCNSPKVWSAANQDGTGLGGRAAAELFRVALPADNNVDLHRIFWMPTTPYIEAGVDASACVNSLLAAAPAATATRRLLNRDLRQTKPTWTTTRTLVTGVKVDWQLQKEDGTPVTAVTEAYRSGSINNAMTPPTTKLEVPGNLADVSDATGVYALLSASQGCVLGRVTGWDEALCIHTHLERAVVITRAWVQPEAAGMKACCREPPCTLSLPHTTAYRSPDGDIQRPPGSIQTS